jgi:hypothetical protein
MREKMRYLYFSKGKIKGEEKMGYKEKGGWVGSLIFKKELYYSII